MSRVCTFCEAPLRTSRGQSIRNKEHAIPDWLQRHLKISDTKYPTALVKVVEQPKNELDPGTSRITNRRDGFALDAKQLGTVCKDCNGGWMGKIETKVSQFLKPCLDGVRPISSLSKEEHELLRQWMLKTAYVYERVARHGTSMIDLELVRRIMRSEPLPPDLWLFGIQSPERAPTYSIDLDRSWYVSHRSELSEEQVREYTLRTFKFSLFVGHVVFTLAHVPGFREGWLPVAWDGVHELLAPSNMLCQWANWSIAFPYFQAGIASQIGLMLSRFGWRQEKNVVAILDGSGVRHVEALAHEMAFDTGFQRALQLRQEIHIPPSP